MGSRRRQTQISLGGQRTGQTRANFGQEVGHTTPVGFYPEGATPHGLMDMAGNVREWMENPDSQYSGARALRGGSWDDVAGYLRCSERFDFNPVLRDYDDGFRVVRPQSKN